MKNHKHLILIPLLLVGFALTACTPQEQADQQTSETAEMTAAALLPTIGASYPYPAPQNPVAYPVPSAGNLPYPVANQPRFTYPAPSEANTNPYPQPTIPTPVPVEEKPFLLDKPIVANASTVTGSGPAGIPILIADVTFMGEILGEGTIGQDGTFSIDLVAPATETHLIGLALGDLKGTAWEFNAFTEPGFMGPGAQQVPMVGFMYDTFLIEAAK